MERPDLISPVALAAACHCENVMFGELAKGAVLKLLSTSALFLKSPCLSQQLCCRHKFVHANDARWGATSTGQDGCAFF